MVAKKIGAALLGAAIVLSACSAPHAESGSEKGTGDSARATLSSSSETSASPPSPAASPSRSASGSGSASGSAKPAPAATGWGPTRGELRRARSLVGELSLRELAGQVIVAEYTGRNAPSALVTRLHLGGVIVMADNVGSTARLRRSNRALSEAASKAGRRWPVFIGVDQEGGVVERVKGAATRFPAFMSAGAAADAGLTRRAAAGSGAELRHLGFTAVFAPDADVTIGPADPTIGSRSASDRPAVVARQVQAAVRGYQDAAILPVIKHFPGHGSVPVDSHEALPVQDKSLPALRRTDLVPFRHGVQVGVPSIMVGHIDTRAVDPGTPGTVSRPVVSGLLRRDLGFEGLAISDAMNMAAVADRYPSGPAAVRTLNAGVDVVLMPPDPVAARDGILRAVRDGRLARPRLRQAAVRQVATLLHLRRTDPRVPPRPPGTSRGASYRLSAGAATIVSGPCQGRLVGRSVRALGPPLTVARFNKAARRAGLGTGAGTSVALIGYAGSARTADVVVATDTPYVLGRSGARIAKIAMYGDTPGAMRALVDVLLGKARAPGRLPVRVPGVTRRGC